MALALTMASGVAMAAYQLDQQQTSFNGELFIDKPYLQTFTAGRTGELRTDLYIGCCKDESGNPGGTPPADLEVLLIENPKQLFGGRLVDSFTIPASHFATTDGSMGWWGFGWWFSVEAGKQYGIRLETNGEGPPYYLWAYNDPGGYSGGDLSYFDVDNFRYVTLPSQDATFKTHVESMNYTGPDTTITSQPNNPTNSTTASFSFTSTEPGSTFECSKDNQTWATCTSPYNYSSTALQNGSHDFYVMTIDAAGNFDETPASYSWTVDTTAPVAKAPAHSFPTTSTLGTSTTSNSVPVKLSWSATENTGGSGIASYQLQQSVDGGAYTNVTLPSATTTTISPSLTPTKTYRFRVAAKDKAGNASAWSYGPSFKVDAYQESSSSIVDTGTWTTSALSGAYGGSVQYANALRRNATFTVPAGTKNVEWVSTKAGDRGKAQVWLDGIQQDANPSATGIQPFDLYSSSTQPRKVVFSKAVTPATSHKLEVKVLGQKNTSSTGTQVDIDAFMTTN
jgi:hypothetical protein